MDIVVSSVKRVFKHDKNKITLPDPNPSWRPSEVGKFYATRYPDLTTCTVHGPVYKDDEIIYTFKTVIGTKG